VLQEVLTAHGFPRVAIVTGGLPLGGSTTFLCNLAGEFVRRDIPTQILSFQKENPLASDFQRLGISVFCQDEKSNIYEDRMLAILRQLAEFKPSAVLANLGSESFETLRYLPKSVYRIGIVQSDDPGVYEEMQIYVPHLNALAAVSKKIEQELGPIAALQKIPVFYLPYGVPMPENLPSRASHQPLKILYLGRLYQEQKRVRLFPEILEQLKSTGMPFIWTIAGEGPERNFLEQTMKSSPEQTVRFIGKVSYENVPECLNENDVFLLGSDYEGLPLSLLEAMGHGLVPVVSDLPSGIGEVVNETNGIKVPIHDVAGYAEAIFWLHGHRKEMSRMADAAREKVKTDFSVFAMTERWLTVFSKVKDEIPQWPATWNIKPILNVSHPIYYSRPVRMIRRLAKKLKPV
jgi:glycosyltransferase involved in cell wall biosynthesis